MLQTSFLITKNIKKAGFERIITVLLSSFGMGLDVKTWVQVTLKRQILLMSMHSKL